MTLTSLLFLPMVLSAPAPEPLPRVWLVQAVSYNVPVFLPVCDYEWCPLHQTGDATLVTDNPSAIGILKVSEEIVVAFDGGYQEHYLPVPSGQSDNFIADNLPDLWIEMLEKDLTETLHFHIEE